MLTRDPQAGGRDLLDRCVTSPALAGAELEFIQLEFSPLLGGLPAAALDRLAADPDSKQVRRVPCG